MSLSLSLSLSLLSAVCCKVRGPFQKFCTLYVFSLKMNLFYKIHLQAFNVISIVLYHSSPTFEKVLYSCLDAFVVDASDYSGRLIRHLLNASEAFPTVSSEQVKVWWAQPTVVQRLGKSCISVWTPSLLMHLITQVASLDTSSMLLKRFPQSGFFNFGNNSKSGGLSPPYFI
jgi:hypothetical protein